MDSFDIKETILKLVIANKGVTLIDIINYLDYVNKVRYSNFEVTKFLADLVDEKKIFIEEGIWYKNK